VNRLRSSAGFTGGRYAPQKVDLRVISSSLCQKLGEGGSFPTFRQTLRIDTLAGRMAISELPKVSVRFSRNRPFERLLLGSGDRLLSATSGRRTVGFIT